MKNPAHALGLLAGLPALALLLLNVQAQAEAQPNLPAQTPAQTPTQSPPQSPGAAPLIISIDDLAGPNGPGSAHSSHPHWKVEPGYGWGGAYGGFDGGFDDGFDDGWLW